MAHSVSAQSPRVEVLASTLVMGGAEKVIAALVRGLPAHGFAPRVLCLHAPGDIGLEITRAGTPVLSRIARHRLDPFVPWRLAAILERGRSAVLVSLDHHDAILWGALAARLAGIRRRVLAVHSTGLWKTGRSFAWSDRLVLRGYDRIIALANVHADFLATHERVAADKLCVINNGVDTSRFQPAGSDEKRNAMRDALGLPRNSFLVTMVAALRPEKNHEMLLAAASRIRDLRGDLTFLVVGEGTEAGKLQARARDLSLGTAVRFMGKREDVPALLMAADASVLCSHPVVETFPLAVLEAMASGLPVVATNVGALREMLETGTEGFLVAPGDTDALAAKLLELAGDPALRTKIGAAARARVVREFSEERMVTRYADLFAGLSQ
jgi:glycosyltransferase involved in cell wall biosynthesis